MLPSAGCCGRSCRRRAASSSSFKSPASELWFSSSLCGLASVVLVFCQETASQDAGLICHLGKVLIHDVGQLVRCPPPSIVVLPGRWLAGQTGGGRSGSPPAFLKRPSRRLCSLAVAVNGVALQICPLRLRPKTPSSGRGGPRKQRAGSLGKTEGSPRAELQVNPPSPPRCKGTHKPQAMVQHLSQNGYLCICIYIYMYLSLSLPGSSYPSLSLSRSLTPSLPPPISSTGHRGLSRSPGLLAPHVLWGIEGK